jgi:hypothetical protein
MEDEHKKPYLVETMAHYGDEESIEDYLAANLAEGWELVSVVGSTFYFKAVSQ